MQQTEKKNITSTSIFTSGTLYTVLVIALFLHILWDAGLHPLIPYTATHHLIVHANLDRTQKPHCCSSPHRAPQASETLTGIRASDTTKPGLALLTGRVTLYMFRRHDEIRAN